MRPGLRLLNLKVWSCTPHASLVYGPRFLGRRIFLPPANMKAVKISRSNDEILICGWHRECVFVQEILTGAEVSNHIKGTLVVELLDVPCNDLRFSFLSLHVRLAPRALQGNTSNLLHEDPLKAKFVVGSGTVCDDSWDRDGSMFSNVGNCCHLAYSLVEWLHREGDAEGAGNLALGSVTIKGGDSVWLLIKGYWQVF